MTTHEYLVTSKAGMYQFGVYVRAENQLAAIRKLSLREDNVYTVHFVATDKAGRDNNVLVYDGR